MASEILYLFVCLSVCLFVYLFICSFIRSFVRSLACLFILSIVRLFVFSHICLNARCCVFRFDGWVVCEEHRDSLVYAWQEEQAILQQKELDVCLAVFCEFVKYILVAYLTINLVEALLVVIGNRCDLTSL